MIAKGGTPAAAATTLDAFQWQNRIVLSFIAEAEMSAAREQRDNRTTALQAWRERDLVLIEVAPSNQVVVDGELDAALDGTALRERFDVGPGRHTTILVGKDGYEKLRSDSAIANDLLFRTIDAMPMRQREIRAD